LKFRKLIDGYSKLPYATDDYRLVQWLVEEPQLTKAEALFIYDQLVRRCAPVNSSMCEIVEDIWKNVTLHAIVSRMIQDNDEYKNRLLLR
jgi:hypothetical protein